MLLFLFAFSGVILATDELLGVVLSKQQAKKNTKELNHGQNHAREGKQKQYRNNMKLF